MANKVLFGLSNLYIGTYAVNDGVVTLGTPYHQAGAVGFSPDQSTDTNVFYADNVEYYSSISEGAIEGDIEVAMFDDAFKTQFLGYKTLADGGLAQVKNPTKPNVYVAFEISGDREARRCIFFNGTLGAISREYATTEDSIEPQTESISVSFVGDNASGVRMATYKPGDTGYSTLFSAPTAPSIATN